MGKFDSAMDYLKSVINHGLEGSTYIAHTSKVTRTAAADNFELLSNQLERQFDVKTYGAVGDGSNDDTAAIQAAITAAGSGEVFFPAGTYNVAGSLTISTDGVRLTGSGLAAKLAQQTANSKTLDITGDNVIVDGMHLYGLGTEDPWGGATHIGASGIYITTANYVRVNNCLFTNHASSDVFLDGVCIGCKITNNTMIGMGSPTIVGNDNGSDGAIVYSGAGSLAKDDLVISGNDISDHAFGILGVGGDGVVITGNTIHDIPGQHGMYLALPGELSVVGNVIRDIQVNGIKLQNQAAADLDGVISITGNTVSRVSQLAGSSGAGIAALWTGAADGFYFTNLSIVGNNVFDSYYGLYVIGVKGAHIVDNRIDTASYIAAYLGSVEGSFYGNRLSNSDACALYCLPDGGTIDVKNLIIIDSPLDAAATNAVIRGAAIYLADSVAPDNGWVFIGDVQVRMEASSEPAGIDYTISTDANAQVRVMGPLDSDLTVGNNWAGSVLFDSAVVPTCTDAQAPNNAVYYSSNRALLCYKSTAGAVNTIDITAV